jgi:hypothetical protein
MKVKKGIMICFALVFALSIGSAFAWDRCYQDVNYTPELWVSFYGDVIYGQAILEGSSAFPAAITGKVYGGYAYFAIDYLENLGLRFYWVNVQGGAGETWGVDTTTGEFYDYPHSAQLGGCGLAIDSVDLGTGAMVVD